MWNPLYTFQSKVKKAIFTMSKKSFDQTLQELGRANWRLRRMQESTNFLADARRKKTQSRPDFALIREQASNLCTALTSPKKPSRCRCGQKHAASLQLQTRLRKESNPRVMDSSFHIRYLGFDTPTRLDTPTRQQPIEIVSRGFDGWPNGNQGITNSIVQLTPSPRSLGKYPLHCSNISPITDTCSAIFESRLDEEWISAGFLVGKEISTNPTPLHYVYILKPKKDTKTASLESLLEQSPRRYCPQTMPWGERLSIAVKIASSVLQLIGTPWLPDPLTTKDITLHSPKSIVKDEPEPQDIEAFITWNLESHEGSSIWPSEVSRQCRAISALGQILIELSIGNLPLSPTDDHPMSASDRTKGASPGLAFLYDVYAQSGLNYSNVVERCLACPWKRQPDRFGVDREFEQTVFKSIVQPLAEDLDHFSGNGRFTRSKPER